MIRALELPTVVLVEDSDEDADTVQTAFARSGVTATLRRVASGDACIALLRTPGQTLPALVVVRSGDWMTICRSLFCPAPVCCQMR